MRHWRNRHSERRRWVGGAARVLVAIHLNYAQFVSVPHPLEQDAARQLGCPSGHMLEANINPPRIAGQARRDLLGPSRQLRTAIRLARLEPELSGSNSAIQSRGSRLSRHTLAR